MGAYIIEAVLCFLVGGLSQMPRRLYYHSQWFRVFGAHRSTPAVPGFFQARLLNYKIV